MSTKFGYQPPHTITLELPNRAAAISKAIVATIEGKKS